MTKSKWIVDPAHSNIDFSVRHMMISRVKGAFKSFNASIKADPTDLTTAEIQVEIDLSSIDTRNSDRDQHLKSADFFDIEKYPTLTFRTTNITRTGDGEYEVTGDVNFHGVTRPETFTVVFEGVAKDPMSGKEKAGFSANGVIKRSNYNLTWNAPLETGGVLVGDDVKVAIYIEAAKED
ncbi:MAG: polyisoprenoid-binding protein [Bacillales bacterium]|nr:polyisoprenoid-binding protein [Bacillales bacterium]